MRTYMTPEEHARIHRRRRRQGLGLVMALLMIVGVFTMLRVAFGALAQLFDDTEQRQEYEEKLEGLVLFDPLPFDGIENLDDLVLREAAVWGCVYSIQETQGGFDGYERDPETEQLLLPAIEVDASLAKLIGPSFQLEHHSFTMEDMDIEYDESAQCYRIPVTGVVGYYRATVTDLFKRGGRLYVTVGYIPQNTQSDLINSSTDTPTKYMDYIFDRSGGSWYLTGLTESETKPASSAPVSEQNPVIMMDEQQLQEAIRAGVDPNAPTSEETASSEEIASSEEAASSEIASSESEEEGEEEEADSTASEAA